MLQARFDRLEYDARRTAREINDRRELLDWHLNARKELQVHQASIKSAKAAEAAAAEAAQEQEATPTPKSYGLLRSTSTASRLGVKVVGDSSPSKLSNTFGSFSSPSLRQDKCSDSRSATRRQTCSLLQMPVDLRTTKTMHERMNEMMASAESNARGLQECRAHLNGFQDIKRQMQETKSKTGGNFSLTDPLPPKTHLPSTGNIQRLSYDSRVSFVTNYGLKNLDDAVKENPPPYPVHPTSSMRSRLEACEHRVLWNHQTMSHNQNFLDDYRSFAKA